MRFSGNDYHWHCEQSMQCFCISMKYENFFGNGFIFLVNMYQHVTVDFPSTFPNFIVMFSRLKSMKAELDEREADLQRKAQERRQKWQSQGLQTRKLGRLKYP